jgi:hypothetical protein
MKFVCPASMRRARVPAQRIKGSQDGAGDYNNGGEEEHGRLSTASIAEVRALYQRDRERQEADCPHRPRRVGWARIDTGGSALLAGALQSKEGHALTPAQKVMHYEAWK